MRKAVLQIQLSEGNLIAFVPDPYYLTVALQLWTALAELEKAVAFLLAASDVVLDILGSVMLILATWVEKKMFI